MNNSPFGFGAVERPLDPRDFTLGAVQTPVSIPAVYLPDISSVPTHHQHKLPTCGANAFCWLQEFKFSGHFTPRYSWIGFKKIDGFPLDAGTDMRSIFKSGATDGVCDNVLLPDNSFLDLSVYSDPSVVTSSMKKNGELNKVSTYAFTNSPSMNQMKQAIYQNKVVLALVRVGEEWYTKPNGATSYQERDIMPLRTPKKVISGHFITLYGYDNNYIYFKNSWGTEWARGGSGYFSANYLPWVNEIGTVVNVETFNFTRDLTIGSTGSDVIALQNMLITKGFLTIPQGTAKGYFGGLTEKALAHWQQVNNIAPAQGFFGPKSRAFIKLNM